MVIQAKFFICYPLISSAAITAEELIEPNSIATHYWWKWEISVCLTQWSTSPGDCPRTPSCWHVAVIPLKLEEEHMQTLRRKDLEVQSLTLQNKLEEKTWSQEKNLLQQELRHFKQDTFLLYVKLKWLLKHWRQGKRMEEEGEDTLEVTVPPQQPRWVLGCPFFKCRLEIWCGTSSFQIAHMLKGDSN